METELNSQTPINPVEPVLPQEPQQSKPSKHFPVWTGILILLIFGLGIAFGLKYFNKTKAPAPKPDTNTDTTQTPDNTPVNKNEPLVSGLIEWQYPSQTILPIVANKDFVQGAKFYTVGTFKSGQYSGKNLYIALIGMCDGPCGMGALKLVDSGDQVKPYVLLKNYSTPLDSFDKSILDNSKFSIDSGTKISDLDNPDSLTGLNGKLKLSVATPAYFQAPYNLFNATNLKFVYKDPEVGDVYTTPDDPKQVEAFFITNGFYAKSPDSDTLVYAFKPGFMKDDGTAQLTWNDGKQNTLQYAYTDRSGCGGSNYGSVDRETNVQTDLIKAGATNSGDSVYELKNKNSKILKDIYNNDYYVSSGSKMSYDEFISQHPLFFWVDPLNRLIRFKSSAFQPQAECGKPVIYLYPTKTEEVSVKLYPTGGFSYTEPDYAKGWFVSAKPNGELTNLADNKNYPYLFWEGRSSDLYQIPDRGFVVAKNDIHGFLNNKLSQLGLNQKETADFEAYWEPYMDSAPYYFVTFMGNSVMDKIAPVEISPQPDTVIRILMDFRPMSAPIIVQGYDIKTPVRRGFTVVEWGGVKH